jgi:hypothetical protein
MFIKAVTLSNYFKLIKKNCYDASTYRSYFGECKVTSSTISIFILNFGSNWICQYNPIHLIAMKRHNVQTIFEAMQRAKKVKVIDNHCR